MRFTRARRTLFASIAVMAAAAWGWRALAQTTAPATVPVGYAPSPLFKTDVIATDLQAPWAVKFAPDGRVFFTERPGRVRLIDAAGKLLPEPALTVPDIRSWNKMGLEGLVLDPAFTANRFVYTAECYGTGNQHGQLWERIVRYREADNHLIEPKVLIDGIRAFWNHCGGRLLFGPDGKLYVTTGDGDEPLLAQRLDSLNGKVLRLNGDGSVPGDNPFIGRKDVHPAVWSYGHRNPQGISFQPGTGLLFEAEHGPDGGDEINLIKKGQNYGWPFVTHDRTASGVESPLRQFTPSVAPADCTFYDGAMFPALRGELLVGCLRGEAILRVHLDGTRVASVERLIHGQFGRLREVAVAPDGALWITTSEFDPPEGRSRAGYDRILRLTPAGGTVQGFDRPPVAGDIPRPVGGRAIYAQTCLACHGDGRDASLNSNLFIHQWHLCDGTDDGLRRIIRDGNVARGMPGFAGSLSAKDINDVIGYVRQRESRATTKP